MDVCIRKTFLGIVKNIPGVADVLVYSTKSTSCCKFTLEALIVNNKALEERSVYSLYVIVVYSLSLVNCVINLHTPTYLFCNK